VLIPVLLTPVVAAVVSKQQTRLYRSSAGVLISYADVSAASALAHGSEAAFSKDDQSRFLGTQASIARAPEIAQNTLAAARVKKETPGQFLANSSVSISGNTSVMSMSVTDHDRALAVRLARAYADQYIAYRRSLDTDTFNSAIAQVKRRLAENHNPVVRQALIRERDGLKTQAALRTKNALLIDPPSGAALTQPKTARNVAVALGLGVVLGIALAFLVDALDTRMRSVDHLAEELDLPVLAAVPPPPRRLRDKLAMLEDPRGVQSEAYRMLRANLALADVERDAQVILVSSALSGEGKSTTVANLAVAIARAGGRVTVVDLDLRKPAIARLFGLEGRPGLTNVALGKVSLEQALARSVMKPAGGGTAKPKGETNGHSEVGGVLQVLTSGPRPPSPGEFAASRRVGQILGELRQTADIVLLDTPPLLQVGDALALSSQADAMLVVAKLRSIRRRAVHALRGRLESAPARKLGLVVTDVGGDEGYYGYYGVYGYGEPVEASEETAAGRTADEAERPAKA
jgi:succinoglycan biosynthesis transport protein ExoP